MDAVADTAPCCAALRQEMDDARAAAAAALEASAAATPAAVAAGDASAAAATVSKATEAAALAARSTAAAERAERAASVAVAASAAAERLRASSLRRRPPPPVKPSHITEERKIKMKKSMEYAIERFQFFAKELHSTANYNYYEHHDMVEGSTISDFAAIVDAIADQLKMTSFKCQDNLNNASTPPDSDNDDDPELAREIFYEQKHMFDPPGPTLAEWCDENDVDIEDLLDKYM